MPLYPTVVSRRARSYIQGGGQSVARHTALSASRTFIPVNAAEAQAMAEAMAKAIANPANVNRVAPLTINGLRVVLPWVNAIALGLLAKELYDQFFASVELQNILPGQPGPANYVSDAMPAPWDGFPNNSNGPPNYDRADTGGNYVSFNPLLDGVAMPSVNPVDYGTWHQRHFFGNPTGEWWNAVHYTRTADLLQTVLLPGSMGAMRNLQHVFPQFAPFPDVAPGADIAREMANDPFPQGYKTGPEGDYQFELAPEAAPHPNLNPSPRLASQAAPLPTIAPGNFRQILPGSGPVAYSAAPNVVVEITPGAAPRTGTGSYSNLPPKNTSEKEIKTKTSPNPRSVAMRLYNAATETQDAIQAIYKTLPKEVRRKQKRTTQNMVRLIWKHRDKLNAADVINALLNENATDIYWGKQGSFDGKAQQNIHDSGLGPSGGPTLGTRNSHLPGVGSMPNF